MYDDKAGIGTDLASNMAYGKYLYTWIIINVIVNIYLCMYVYIYIYKSCMMILHPSGHMENNCMHMIDYECNSTYVCMYVFV
jgi:hypothetical protein